MGVDVTVTSPALVRAHRNIPTEIDTEAWGGYNVYNEVIYRF